MTPNPAQDDFWQKFIEIEHGIVNCPVCRKYSDDDPCSRQLSWAGSEYKPGGLVFVLQNPGSPAVSGIGRIRYLKRDQRLRPLLLRFRDSATVENYRLVVSEMQTQMQGLLPADKHKWLKWAHPVSKCIKDCLTIEHVVWANVVKHRTPGGAAKDRPTIPAEQEHGLRQHLKAELDVLRPRAVVAVGMPAASAIVALEGQWRVMHIKAQGAAECDASRIREKIRALGLCQH